MPRHLNIILVLLALCPTSKIIATGGMTSGGGELLGNTINPWFANMSRPLTACIEIDEFNFGLSTERVTQLVGEAFDYWEAEIAQASSTPYNGHVLSVVPPGLTLLESCENSPDLKFQFGILNPSQEEFLQTPQNLVAVAIRDQYDERTLTGRGFIYVSPQSGRLAMSHTGLIDTPWSFENGKILRLVLLHELGHVFGAPHSGDRFHLMSAGFPETIVQEDMVLWQAFLPHWPEVFRFRESRSHVRCSSTPQDSIVHQIFQIPLDYQCVSIKLDQEEFKLSMSHNDQGPWHLAGSARFVDPPSVRAQSYIRLRLSSLQEVFPHYDLFDPYMSGPKIVHERRFASYASTDGTHQTSIMVDLAPHCWAVHALENQSISFDLFASCY